MLLSVLFLSGLASASFPSSFPEAAAQIACTVLEKKYPQFTYAANSTEYIEEVEVPWSARSWRSPACIFAPSNAIQLSYAVKTFALHGTRFSMRGGGHMPIASSNSIGEGGVLLSSTNLDGMQLSADKQTFSVGPGRSWGDVYQALDGTGLAVVGGRLGPVGVAGFLLGGGMSFYSHEYGLGSTNGNVQGYECVLGDGKIVEATASNKHSELFWALQGGGNSFCLVTRFDLQTRDSPTVMLGFPSYGSSEVKDKFIDSVYNFATGGQSDPKGSIIPLTQYTSGTAGPVFSATLFYNGNSAQPKVLKDWLGGRLTPADGTTSLLPISMAQYSGLIKPVFADGGASHGMRQRFHLLPLLANKKAMKIIHDMYFEAAQEHFANVAGVSLGFTFNPVTSKFLSASNAKPGSLQGLDERPALWIEQAYSWTNEADDTKISNFINYFNANATRVARALNVTGPFYYLNDADENQPVFENYPAGNLERMQAIRDKYDPYRTFTDLMPGGFKVAKVGQPHWK